MKETKLVEILKTLSKDEFRDLEKFISSPYFRKRDVSGLYKIIKPFYPDFEDKNFTKEFVFEKLFPSKKFIEKKSDTLLRTIISDLFIACKDYLVHLEMNNQKSLKKFFLLKQLRDRKLYKEFIRENEDPGIELKNSKDELTYNFLEKYFLVNPVIEFYNDKSEFEKLFENLTKQCEYLTAAALLKGLRFPDQKKIAEDGYNLKTRYSLVENFMNHLDVKTMISDMKKNNDYFTPFIEIYYYANQMVINPNDEQNYYAHVKLLLSGKLELPQSEMYMMFSIAATYCNDKIILDKSKFENEIFNIYDNMLKLDAYKYSREDYFAPGMFRNMLIEARINKKYEWMKKLIDNYLNELHPDHIESMTYYSLGQYYFAIGENGKALENFIKLKSEYFLFKKDLKNLLFRIYYNLEYFDEAYSVLDSMKHYIASSKELSESIKISSRKFILFASELLNIRTGLKFENAGYFIEKIKKENNVESYDWLLEKANEINL